MSKRAAEYGEEDGGELRKRDQMNGARKIEDESAENDQVAAELGIEGGMENLSGDDYDSEGEIVELGEDGEEVGDADVEMEVDQQQQGKQLYLPHRAKPLGPDEVLEADPSVYEMLHNVHMPWPCLTLDVLPDKFGNDRRSYPAKVYAATGTQAAKAKDNEIIVMKLSSLSKTLVKNEDEEDEEEDEDETSVDPVLESETIPMKSTINRLRTSPFAGKSPEYLTATMCENGEVCIFDLGAQMKAFDTPGYSIPKPSRRPLHIVKTHGNVEGYGLDWSPTVDGSLLTGDCIGRVHLTQRTTTKFVTDNTPFQANDASIEDIQWSRTEQTVFATAGVDGYVRIWDTRSKKHKPALSVVASKSDVNVISWCDKIDYLLASGHDDGSWGVWDLRNFKPNATPTPVVSYDFHKSPITSIAFNPLDESIVAVSSEDNTVTLWDLAVEADDEEIAQQKLADSDLEGIPPQLLFVHWQRDVKDVRWHRQIPGALVSTGTDGMNIWKTISV